MIWAFHWYSETPFTRMNVLERGDGMGIACLGADSPVLHDAALAPRCRCAQLTITEVPTRSVRYGYRFSWAA